MRARLGDELLIRSGRSHEGNNLCLESRNESVLMPSDSASDPLDQVDRILEEYAQSVLLQAEETAQLQADQDAFLESFSARCEDEVRPAMESVVARLRKNGGGGVIKYERNGGAGRTTPRLTLWMSLQGELTGSPRQDRHPYLQFDADTKTRKVKVSAGDMWEGGGSHFSGPLGLRALNTVTSETVIQGALEILRRAARVADV